MNHPKETYNLKQIVQVVKDIYAVDSIPDSWGVPVVYEVTFMRELKKRLKHIKEFIK